MTINEKLRHLDKRDAPLEMHGDEFRKIGHQLIEDIAEFLDGLPQRPVTTNDSAQAIRQLLGSHKIPEKGASAQDLFSEVTGQLFDHSLFNGHPRFWGYITSSAAPIGALADLLAAAANPNVGAAILSPFATEIESQTIRWIADLIGYPRSCGGLLVSGGNVANFVCFLAARTSKANWDIQKEGLISGQKRLIAYVSKETHTWIDKAAELSSLGSKSVRWIETNPEQQIDIDALEKQINLDIEDNGLPFLLVGTAGTVSTGAVDPLNELARICKKYNLWFHVDGAYGAPAAALPSTEEVFKGLHMADSIALDPHKWLYSPLEAGCALVRDQQHLIDTFSHHPAYYNFDGEKENPPINYLDFGLQNSRGFRALKVWLGLRQVGREGYIQMIGDDIALAEALYTSLLKYPMLQAITQNLSITTFRYVPEDLQDGSAENEAYLNMLNEELLNRIQKGGEAFVSNAIVNNQYLLRACIVNFRTSLSDVEALPEIVIRVGREVDTEIRSGELKGLGK